MDGFDVVHVDLISRVAVLKHDKHGALSCRREVESDLCIIFIRFDASLCSVLLFKPSHRLVRGHDDSGDHIVT